MKIIVLTGTPGTGKTTVAKMLCKKRGFARISLSLLAKKGKFFSKKGKDGALVAKLLPLQKKANFIISASKKSIIIDGHLAADMKLRADKVIILRLHPKILRRRLLKRKYSKEKISQNLLCEALDYCTLRVQKNYPAKKIFEINVAGTGKTGLLQKVENIIFGKKLPKNEKIDFSLFLIE